MNDDTARRRSRSLDGEWMFEVDPDGIGMTEGWQTDLAMWLTEANPVDVPHIWQENDGLRGYAGTAWYNRTFRIDPAELESGRAFVEFGAVDYWATVWVNGKRVGEHRGGYLPFEFEITDAITPGENTLTVAVHDPEDLSEIPHGKQGEPWFTRVSGIWQSVTLAFRPETHVSGANVTPDLETDTAVVALDVDAGDTAPTAVDAVVRASREGTVEAVAVQPLEEGGDVVLEFDDPAYWSPDSPALYDLEITLEANGEVLDRYEDYFGLRSIERDGDEFRLNGDPIRLRGVLDQGYFPTTLYRPPDDGDADDVFERELERVSELGFNLVRKHLKPAHPDFLEAADRKGILVWEEAANPARYTDRSKEEVKTQLRRLVERDYNRPSVVVWGLYHEEWGIGHNEAEETLWTDETKQRYLASLVETVREWDPTRLVCDNSGWAHVDTDLNDYHWYCISPDRATEWMENLEHTLHHRRDNYATQPTTDDDGAPVVISEFGVLSFPSLSVLVDHYGREPAWFSHEFLSDPVKRPSGVQDRFSETGLDDVFGTLEDLADCWQHRASVSLEHILGEFRTREDVAGFVLTQLYDTEWEVTGLLDYCRNEKSVYDDVAAMNADVTLVATVDSHVAWAGENLELEIALVNDTDERVVEAVEWEVEGASETRQLSAPPHSVAELDPIRFSLPHVESVRTTDATVRGRSETGQSISKPITVVPSANDPPEALVFAEGTLASRLASAGLDVTHRLTSDVDVAFVTDTTREVVEFVSNGGTAVQVPDRQGEMRRSDFFEFRTLPRTDSWNNTASFFYQDSPLVDEFCPNRHLGWEFEDTYPYEIVATVDSDRDTVHVGYVRGWLADWGSPLLERPVDDGRVVACTFRVQTTAGSHPVVTGLLFNLVEYLAETD